MSENTAESKTAVVAFTEANGGFIACDIKFSQTGEASLIDVLAMAAGQLVNELAAGGIGKKLVITMANRFHRENMKSPTIKQGDE
ncbi:MAG: hypothetical protein PHV82_19025 [Victivallaceae bacterium]|nr:hypothetical protein [Victivallaceae bacterium]